MYRHGLCVLSSAAALVWSVGLAGAQPAVEPTFEEQIAKLVRAQQYTEALQLSLKKLAGDPKGVATREGLAMAFEGCVMKGQVKVAESHFIDWSQRAPNNALAHVWLGAALAAQPGRETEAEGAYQQALQLDPKSPDAHFWLAALRELQDKEEEAQTLWRKFLEVEPDSDRAWLVRHGLAVMEAKLMAPEGGDPQEWYPIWSPDGKQIAYHRGWENVLTVRRLVSGEERNLNVPMPKAGSLDWSPDGRLIVVSGATADWKMKQLFMLDLASGDSVPLYAKSNPQQARWSPDGTGIVFDTELGLWTLRADGTGAMRVPGYGALGNYHCLASFTPDGRWLCSAGNVRRGPLLSRGVFLWRFDDGTQRVALVVNAADNQHPLVRPDSRTVLFSSNLGGSQRHLRAVAIGEPGRDVLVLHCFSDFEWGPVATWSPDGRQFAVSRPWPGRLWIVTLGGLDTRPIRISTVAQPGSLTVMLTNRANEPRTVNLTYRLFHGNSVLVAEGAVGKVDMPLKPGEVIECPLKLDAVKQPGMYTVKLTAVIENGERVVKLVDYMLK